jgi:ArsR family transcriptional regulator, arsenate/arsenite/antimonite-responsive transcriptional repressor
MAAVSHREKIPGCVPEECVNRTVIPEQLQSELSGIGGVRGLCDNIPTEEKIEQIISFHHALSDPVRVKIVYLVSVQPLCVCVIKACLGISDSKLSYHLAILKKADLIEGIQDGNYIVYSLTSTGTSCTRKTETQLYPSYYTIAD